MNKLTAGIRSGCLHFISFILPDNQQVIYILKNVFDFTYDEISEIPEISKNVIKARLNRARANRI